MTNMSENHDYPSFFRTYSEYKLSQKARAFSRCCSDVCVFVVVQMEWNKQKESSFVLFDGSVMNTALMIPMDDPRRLMPCKCSNDDELHEIG